MAQVIVGLDFEISKALAKMRELSLAGTQGAQQVARTAERITSSASGRSFLPVSQLQAQAAAVGTIRGLLPSRGGGTEQQRQELFQSGVIASPTAEAVAQTRAAATAYASALREAAGQYSREARQSVTDAAQRRTIAAQERQALLASGQAASISAEVAQTQVRAGRRKAAADNKAADVTERATRDLAAGTDQALARLRTSIGGFAARAGISPERITELAGGRALGDLGGPELEELRATLRQEANRIRTRAQQRAAADAAATTATRSFAALQEEAAANAAISVQNYREKVALEEANNVALFQELSANRDLAAAAGLAAAARQAQAGILQAATAEAFAADPALRGAVTGGRVATAREQATQQAIVAEQLLTRDFIATKARGLVLEQRRNLAIQEQVQLDEGLIASKARELVTQQRRNALMAEAVRAEAARVGLSEAQTAVLVGRFGPPGGGGGGGAGGLGPQFGGGFFGGGIRSIVRYGLPGIALYGAVNELRQSLEEATKLQVQLEIIRGTLASVGQASSFDDVADGILDVARATATASSEVADVQRQLAGAFAGVDLQPDFERARLESEAGLQLARVAGLPVQEITDSLTAVALAFNEPEGAFERIGDLIVGLENRFGVLSAEVVRFTADLAPLGAELGFTAEELSIYGAAAQQVSGQTGGVLAEQFRRIFAGIQERGPELQALFAGLPDVARQIGEALGAGDIAAIVELLIRNYENLDESQRNALAALVGGRREAGSFLALLNSGPAIIEQFSQGTEQFAGSLDERFNAVRESLSFTFDEMRRSIEQLAFSILDAGIAEGIVDILDALRTSFEVIGGVFRFLGNINEFLGGIPGRIAGLALAFIGLNKALELVIASFIHVRQQAAAAAGTAATATTQLQAAAAGGAAAQGGRFAQFARDGGTALIAAPLAISGLSGSYRAGADRDIRLYIESIAQNTVTGLLAGGPAGGLVGLGSSVAATVAGRLFGGGGDEDREPIALESVYESQENQERLIAQAREEQLTVEQALTAYERGIASQGQVIAAYQQQLRGVQDRIRGAAEAGVDTGDLEREAADIQAELNQFVADSINTRFDAIESINLSFRLGGDPQLSFSLAQARLRRLQASGAASLADLQEAAQAVLQAQGEVFQQQLEQIEDDAARAAAAQAGVPADTNAREVLARVAVATLATSADLEEISEFLSLAPRVRETAHLVQRVSAKGVPLDIPGLEIRTEVLTPGQTVTTQQVFDELLRVALGELQLEDTLIQQTVEVLRERVRNMRAFAENIARLLGKDNPAFTSLRTIIGVIQNQINGIVGIVQDFDLIDIPEQINDISQDLDPGAANDLARQIAEARLNLAEALIEGDPVAEADIARRRADLAFQFAENEADRINALADRVRADRAWQDAIDDIFNSRTELAIALAEAAGNEVLAAELAYKLALDELQQARDRGAGEAELNRLEGEAAAAQRASQDAFLNDRRDYYQYLNDIGQITDQQLIGYLQSLLAIPTLTEQQRRDIEREIHRLRESLSADFRFNLPTQLGLPTFYEVARVQQGGGLGAGYNDNRIVTNNISINGSNLTQDQLTNAIVNAVGDPKRVGTYDRRY